MPAGHLAVVERLMAWFAVCSGRTCYEGPQYDLLYKWLLDPDIMHDSFDHSMFSKNR